MCHSTLHSDLLPSAASRPEIYSKAPREREETIYAKKDEIKLIHCQNPRTTSVKGFIFYPVRTHAIAAQRSAAHPSSKQKATHRLTHPNLPTSSFNINCTGFTLIIRPPSPSFAFLEPNWKTTHNSSNILFFRAITTPFLPSANNRERGQNIDDMSQPWESNQPELVANKVLRRAEVGKVGLLFKRWY